ncbi:hypothetical protein L208DRAFT_1374724 [Tricholoma matsutake]|nr:hypothetical protein L208DRAFT_1374724 [Tricholoma matsutake 945]
MQPELGVKEKERLVKEYDERMKGRPGEERIAAREKYRRESDEFMEARLARMWRPLFLAEERAVEHFEEVLRKKWNPETVEKFKRKQEERLAEKHAEERISAREKYKREQDEFMEAVEAADDAEVASTWWPLSLAEERALEHF